jgi:hypothetical protein
MNISNNLPRALTPQELTSPTATHIQTSACNRVSAGDTRAFFSFHFGWNYLGPRNSCNGPRKVWYSSLLSAFETRLVWPPFSRRNDHDGHEKVMPMNVAEGKSEFWELSWKQMGRFHRFAATSCWTLNRSCYIVGFSKGSSNSSICASSWTLNRRGNRLSRSYDLDIMTLVCLMLPSEILRFSAIRLN